MNHKLMSAILTYRGNYINGEFLIVLKLKIELDFFKFNDFKNILKIHRVLYSWSIVYIRKYIKYYIDRVFNLHRVELYFSMYLFQVSNPPDNVFQR